MDYLERWYQVCKENHLLPSWKSKALENGTKAIKAYAEKESCHHSQVFVCTCQIGC